MNCAREEKLSMTTSWTYQEHTVKRQPSTGMPGVCLAGGLSLASVKSVVNTFGGRLGQEASIDSRYIRQ